MGQSLFNIYLFVYFIDLFNCLVGPLDLLLNSNPYQVLYIDDIQNYASGYVAKHSTIGGGASSDPETHYLPPHILLLLLVCRVVVLPMT